MKSTQDRSAGRAPVVAAVGLFVGSIVATAEATDSTCTCCTPCADSMAERNVFVPALPATSRAAAAEAVLISTTAVVDVVGVPATTPVAAAGSEAATAAYLRYAGRHCTQPSVERRDAMECV